MPVVATEAVVLHMFDYLESSRILRVLTEDDGVRSVLARGARRSSRRFGSALDLFAQGTAQLHTRPGRELDTLGGFEVHRTRSPLAAELGRFMGASMIAELTLRCARDASDAELFVAVTAALDALATADADHVADAAIAGAWRVVAALGFAPSLDDCSDCHAPLAARDDVLFSHPAGGAVCGRCARLSASGRRFPAAARDALRAWLVGDAHPLGDRAASRAHQRLLREFVREHLGDERALPAFDVWEHDTLAAQA